jgi:hypothetical protein
MRIILYSWLPRTYDKKYDDPLNLANLDLFSMKNPLYKLKSYFLCKNLININQKKIIGKWPIWLTYWTNNASMMDNPTTMSHFMMKTMTQKLSKFILYLLDDIYQQRILQNSSFRLINQYRLFTCYLKDMKYTI